MAKYPIKMLLDEFKRPFFPLVTIDTIVTNNSDKTLKELFDDRYTKAEVDKIISDLGTLQRLRGTVNSYEELLAIENPLPGDTYILLVESGINAEYMYIGDRWEMLGTTATYTDVYSKEVIDRMLLALKQEVNTKAELDDAEVLSQAKIYAEDLFANVPRPNLDDYYKKSEADAKIDEKINAIELPIASANTLGTVKVGANLSIDADGTLNADASGSGTDNTYIDSLPIGTVVAYDGEEIPEGYEEVGDYMPTYSTEETKVGTWTDGKPLYRKSFIVKGITDVSYTHNLADLNMDMCLFDFSHSVLKQGVYSLPFGIYGSNTDYNRVFFQDNNSVVFQFGSIYTMSKDLYFTIEYTKTTDEVL